MRALRPINSSDAASTEPSPARPTLIIDPMDQLEKWLEECYGDSLRTAYLILGNRADAEDAVQEAFLRAWRFRDSVADARSFKPWLYRIVVNSCNTQLRREIPLRSREIGDVTLDTISTTDDEWQRIAESNDIARAVHDLPAPLRVVIVLRYYAGLSEREIATAIGRQPGTVKSRLNSARQLLAVHRALAPEQLIEVQEIEEIENNEFH